MPPQEEKKNKIPDKAHEMLVGDLKRLLEEAEKFEFHGFKNSSYAAPKMMFVQKLHELAEKAMNGEYDN